MAATGQHGVCERGGRVSAADGERSLPSQVRVGLVRGDAGFGDARVQEAAEALRLKFIFVARLTQNVQTLCWHEDAAWQKTQVEGLEVQEVALERGRGGG